MLCGPAAAHRCGGVLLQLGRGSASASRFRHVAFNMGQMVLSTGLAACSYVWLAAEYSRSRPTVFAPWNHGFHGGHVVIPSSPWLSCASWATCCSRRGWRSSRVSLCIHGVDDGRVHTVPVHPGRPRVPASPRYSPLARWRCRSLLPHSLSRGTLPAIRRPEVAYGDTIRALVGALEAKDPYTRGHSERVSEYAVALGGAMGWMRERLSGSSTPPFCTTSASWPSRPGPDQAGEARAGGDGTDSRASGSRCGHDSCGFRPS